MYKARAGNVLFRERIKDPRKQKVFKNFERGQDPEIVFITCSDSRVVPHHITQLKEGDIFTLEVVGNIIPVYHPKSEVCATIEYALDGLAPSDIIVCGHTKCGAMDGLINPEPVKKMPAVRNLLEHSKDVLKIIAEKYPEVKDNNERLQKAIEENVLLQIEHLKTHPVVKERIEKKSIKIHAWVYDILKGEAREYDPIEQTWLLVDPHKEIDALQKKHNKEQEQEQEQGECKM